MNKEPTAREALTAFGDCIEATGGVRIDRLGNAHPRADQEWTDLGNAYLLACRALGREPVTRRDEDAPSYECGDCGDINDYEDLDHPEPGGPTDRPTCPACGSGRLRAVFEDDQE
jgi:DNA-directed RNA polymerase subunit RPC12/RpoP